MGKGENPIVAAQAPPVTKLDDKALIAEAERRGLVVTKERAPEPIVRLDAAEKGRVRFLVVSDTHLGSKWQALTQLHDLYAQARAWGATFALNCGDVVDGTNMHKDQAYGLFRHGADEQCAYAAERYPALKGKRGDTLPTYVIQGNHDYSFFKDSGTDVLKMLARERPDLTYLGARGATMKIGGLTAYLHHPMGGVPYARSYRMQKMIEQFSSHEKPHFVFSGHRHVANHLPGYRNVEGFDCPCTQYQTPFLKALGLAPVVGGLLVEAAYGPSGLLDATTRWVLYRKAYKPGKDWP